MKLLICIIETNLENHTHLSDLKGFFKFHPKSEFYVSKW